MISSNLANTQKIYLAPLPPLTLMSILLTQKIHLTEGFQVFSELYQTPGQSLPMWLTVTFILFCVGVLGFVLSRHNVLLTIMHVEVIYLGVVGSFAFYGLVTQDYKMSIYALLIIIFAACESAVGLGLLIVLYRKSGSIGFRSLENLGG